MRLLIRIKNGTPPMRKAALRQITDKAREFGPDALFKQILPLLMSPSVRTLPCVFFPCDTDNDCGGKTARRPRAPLARQGH